MISVEEHKSFTFGPYRLLPHQRLLLRGNRAVKLGGRALDTLHFLVKQPGVTVSKDALFQFVWPNLFVDEANLKVHISSIRKALRDSPHGSRYIATVSGRGYQFVGKVAVEDAALGESPVKEVALGLSDTLLPTDLSRGQLDVSAVLNAILDASW